VSEIKDFREQWRDDGIFSMVIWVLSGLFFAMIAAAVGQFISVDAQGSGIPEMKTVLSGLELFRYLSWRTLLAKILGLVSAIGASLSVGKEGPFVHVSAIVAQKLLHIPIFRHMNENQSARKQALAAAVAAGVTATFGTPVGGVLFSIEVTATYYVVSNLWKSFFCAVICVCCFHLMRSESLVDLFQKTTFENDIFVTDGITWFILLGILCGTIGGLFVIFTSKVCLYKKRKRWGDCMNRYGHVATISVITSVLLWMDNESSIDQIFSAENSHFDSTKLFILFVQGFFLTGLSISSPIPCGLFTPIFIAGACLGRAYGDLVPSIGQLEFDNGAFAVIGAAALCSAVTHTTSVAVIVFELTGQLKLMLPVLLGVLFSYATASIISVSMYDSFLKLKNLPFLPGLLDKSLYRKEAGDLMIPRETYRFLTKNSTLGSIVYLLRRINYEPKMIPVVDRYGKLYCSVQTSSLRKYLIKTYKREQDFMTQDAVNHLKLYFQGLSSMTAISMSRKENRDLKDIVEFLDGNDSDVNLFLSNPIEWNDDKNLRVDFAPFSIHKNLAMSKVHFLFIMLGLHTVYVTDDNKLIGILSKASFKKVVREIPADTTSSSEEPDEEEEEEEEERARHDLELVKGCGDPE